MPKITSTLPEKAQQVTGDALQGALVDLIDLSLAAKQAHWNVVGRNFRSIHLQLDEVVTAARAFSDLVAERASAIGVSPDGRTATVAATSGVPALDAGWIEDVTVVDAFVATLSAVVERMRERVEATADPDPVSQDLLITVTAELEKQRWMFEAERPTS